MPTRKALPFVAALFLVCSACGKEVVRGSNDPSIDSHAISTGLDRVDIERALEVALNDLRAHRTMDAWRTANPKPTVALFPFENHTSEHIEPALETILSKTETWMMKADVVRMISREKQTAMIREVEGQQHPVFNPSNAAKYGRQLGARYYITGKVSAQDERGENMRRVQYYLSMQVIDVETSEIMWQKSADITKAIK